MPFKQADLSGGSRFNSSASCAFIEFYQHALTESIKAKSAGVKSRTFAPSALRCGRKQWFRLRGTQPDLLELPDLALDFKASIGTARHKEIQSILKSKLQDDWISVRDYLLSIEFPYSYTLEESGLETKVRIDSPPISFACDGIVRFREKIYLLEIKTSEYNSWQKLGSAKDIHLDQIKCYCALLDIQDVLVVYEERLNGEWRCFEYHFNDFDLKPILDKLTYVQDMVKMNIAPDALPTGDYMCTNCEYKLKCNEW